MVKINEPTVNNGVYRAGFATTQAAYEAAVISNQGLPTLAVLTM